MENENIAVESPIEDLTDESPVEYIGFDYSGQLETIIELQTQNNKLVAQNNINQLFCIGTLSALLVIMVMYNFIKKFL